MIGRVATTPFMVKFSPNNVLGIYALINSIIIILLYILSGPISVYALIAMFFFMSISFPTIFALSIVNIPSNLVKPASSILVMSIVGGAIMPFIMGKIADVTQSNCRWIFSIISVLFICCLVWI